MFVGHYGPAFAGKAAGRTIPLWVLFVAVQLIDILWTIFVLLGVEKARIVPGITAANPLDLYYMPYTHSLVGAAFWSIAAGIVYRFLRRGDGLTAALIVGAAVFSHWVLDWLVHRPDLALYDDTLKVGLGLWNYPIPALLLELAILFGGMLLYLRATAAATAAGRYGMVIFVVVLAALQWANLYAPPPPSDKVAAATGLVLYAVLTAIAWRLERQRAPRAAGR
jgi:membrane-bound metal-dependent hydrolase YbcI (DUF457 family)